MEIILLERVDKLGDMGKTVNVKNGYARNFLLPRGKAVRANKTNLERFEQQRAELEKRNAEMRDAAQAQAELIEHKTFTLIRQAGESGQLYGSVTPRDVAGLISDENNKIKREQILLTQKIKALGIHPVRIRLHPEIIAMVRINVARTEEDASGQLTAEQAAQSISEAAQDIFEAGAAPDVEDIKQDMAAKADEAGENDKKNNEEENQSPMPLENESSAEKNLNGKN